MISLESVLSSSPFAGRIFFDYENLSTNCEKVTMVSVESDYLAFGKEVEKKVNCGYPVVLKNSFDIDAVLNATRNLKTVVAVGSGNFLSVCRVASLINGFRLVAVITDVLLYKVFQKKVVVFRNGVKTEYFPPYPEKVIANPKKLSVLKRHNLADGFAAVASASAVFSENERVKELVFEATKCAMSASKNLFPAIFKANLFLAAAVSEDDALANGDLFYASVILSKVTASTAEECSFFCLPYMLRLYKIIAESELENLSFYPKYIDAIERLAEIFKTDGCMLYQNFSPLTYDEAKNRILSFKKSYEQRKFSAALATYDSLKNIYSFVYSGRKKRADATKGQMAECLSLAGFYSEGILKAFFSIGAGELLTTAAE